MSDVRDKLFELAKIEVAQYGEAKAKSVIGKAMGKFPELRSQAKDLMSIIDQVIEEVNSYENDVYYDNSDSDNENDNEDNDIYSNYSMHNL